VKEINMSKFWELLKDGTILIFIVVLGIVGTYLAMILMGSPVPESLDRAFWAALYLITGGVVGAGIVAVRAMNA
jgi:Na+/citrate or Na+/malate symporter